MKKKITTFPNLLTEINDLFNMLLKIYAKTDHYRNKRRMYNALPSVVHRCHLMCVSALY